MKKLIFVEDDETLRDVYIQYFKNKGFEITTYPDGNSIISNDFQIPDLFILDFELPGTNGLDICRYLKANKMTAQVPVIIVSGNDSVKDEYKNAGACDFLTKPFNIQKLLVLINQRVM